MTISADAARLALAVLEPFRENGSYEDYQAEDGWDDTQYEAMLDELRAVASPSAQLHIQVVYGSGETELLGPYPTDRARLNIARELWTGDGPVEFSQETDNLMRLDAPAAGGLPDISPFSNGEMEPEDDKFECQNCGKRWPLDQLKPVQDVLQRVDPGEEMPYGECPECGAVCHPDEGPEEDDDDEVRREADPGSS